MNVAKLDVPFIVCHTIMSEAVQTWRKRRNHYDTCAWVAWEVVTLILLIGPCQIENLLHTCIHIE